MKRAEREKQLEVRSHHIFFTNSEFSICNFVIKNNGYIGILYSYIDLWMKIHFEQIKTNDKFYEKKSGFVVSGFVKRCDELDIGCGKRPKC